MRKKLTRANLDQLARKCKVMTLQEMDSLLGGNRNTELTFEQFMSITDFTKWDGAYVYGVKEIDGQLCFVGCTDAYYVSEDSKYVNGTDRPTVFILGYDPSTWVQGIDPSSPISRAQLYGNPFSKLGQKVSGNVFKFYLNKLYEKTNESGIDISKFVFEYSPTKASRASISEDRKTIYIGDSFFKEELENIDRYAVIMHECFHMNFDQTTEKSSNDTIQVKNFEFSANMSEGAFAFFKEELGCNSREEIAKALTFDYTNGAKIHNNIQRYKNEIAAYEYDLNQGYPLSENYKREIEANLYIYKEYVRFLENH